jgi:hypothetical protein
VTMTEEQLLASVIELAGWLKLLSYHTRDSRRSAPGFPDLVLVGSRVLFRELKSSKGKVTEDQYRWIEALDAAGEDVDVWRPFDWDSGRVKTELESIGWAQT